MKFTSSLAITFVLSLASMAQADPDSSPVDLVGKWSVEASTDNGMRELTWTFNKKGGKLEGMSLHHESGDERKFNSIVVKGDSVSLKIKIETEGRKGAIRIEGVEKSPGRIAGDWSMVGDDGTKYADGEFTARKQVLFAGEWVATAELPDGSTDESTLKLVGENSALKGEVDGRLGNIKLDKVNVGDDEVRLDLNVKADGNSLGIVIKFKPEGNDHLVGKWMAVGADGLEVAEGKWSAHRKLALAGKWDVVASVPDSADYHGTLTLVASDGQYSGTSASDSGESRELTSVNVDGKSVELTVPFEYQGNTGKITVEAAVQQDGSLQGEWVLTGSDDETEYVRESWKATKE